MQTPTEALFTSLVWKRALESYASAAHLTVTVFDHQAQVVFGPIHPTPLFQLFEESGYDPGIFAQCARECMAQADDRHPIVVSQFYGLAVVGTSLVLEGKVVGAAVAGYAFVDFSQISEVQGLARDAKIKFDRLWEVARHQKPVPRQRLILNAELLQVLGDALLRENLRTRQYEEIVGQLEETAVITNRTHEELQVSSEALRESEERYRTLFDLEPVGVYSCDAEGVIQTFNHRAEELWGRIPALGDGHERFCGSHRLYTPDGIFLPHGQCPMADVVSGKVPGVSNAEVLIERPDGSRIIVIVNIRPLRNHQGKVIGAVNCFYDITERKQAENELRESEQRFRSLVSVLTDVPWTVNPEGRFVIPQTSWEAYTGQKWEEHRDFGWINAIHPDDRKLVMKVWQRALASGTVYDAYGRLWHAPTQSWRHFTSKATPLPNPDGIVRGWVGTCTDIQDVKEAEASVRAQEVRLHKAEKMASAGQLAASMAHEINNPLSSVTNALYLLGHIPDLDISARSLIEIGSTELARVSRIVKQSLSYHREGVEARSLDLSSIVNQSLTIFSEKLKRAGIEVKSKNGNGMLLTGYPDELRQVVDNLLLNAAEAMPTGGRLNVSVHQSIDWKPNHQNRKGMRLTIADTGYGIPRELRKKIFEPFFTTKSDKGNGLGLWILQGIVSKHDGVMSLRSSATQNKSGTVISIFLPEVPRVPRKPELSKTESVA